jgi:hypothetical protein
MVDALDLLQCPVCGTFYKPKTTATGRAMPHCIPMVQHVLEPVKGVYRAGLRGYSDYRAIERRVVGSRLTEGVVGLPLTGSLLDIEV